MRQGRARLDGKVAIVTGAGTTGPVAGVGSAASILFAREGAKILLIDKALENAEKTLSAIQEEAGEASVFTADVSSSADCQAMTDELAVDQVRGPVEPGNFQKERIRRCHTDSILAKGIEAHALRSELGAWTGRGRSGIRLR